MLQLLVKATPMDESASFYSSASPKEDSDVVFECFLVEFFFFRALLQL